MTEKIVILYDNRAFKELTPDWGFSAFIEGETNILFDTGAKPEILERNAEALSINLSDIDGIFISHNHWDHTGGLKTVMKKVYHVDIFVPESDAEFFEEKVGERGIVIPVDDPTVIAPGIFSTGMMPTGMRDPAFEHSLVAKTEKGSILVTGCSHPGIEKIAEEAVRLAERKLFMIIGGFHMYKKEDTSIKKTAEKLLDLTEFVAPCHCTGDNGIEVFKEVFKDRFIDCRAGTEIAF
ncbi:MBL fold metallo-hydrolase [Desulfurobacterium indicum]|uniref:Metal-dependent hydrolase n=1 Tax=Desulfurobacterium indicum TaxID=1914305 RepID=A0A1R1MM57_9BACT|nr:MBL fold metallo-hydrolase [Desulfurobacterium indicum]OMH40901.1 metal-dependent hydrolase [Desulfurobacterium indicum]